MMANNASDFIIHGLKLSQQYAAAKIGTDALLLGHWFSSDLAYKNLLDIGTGTGILALLAASRFPILKIDAIDPDEGSAKDARFNFLNFNKDNRPSFVLGKLDEFALDATTKYDLILCNPPYHSESVLSPNRTRHQWRHASELPIPSMFHAVSNLMSNMGSFHIIVPYPMWREVANTAVYHQLFITKSCSVSSFKYSKPIRMMLTIRKNYVPAVHEQEWLYDHGQKTSSWYNRLLGKSM